MAEINRHSHSPDYWAADKPEMDKRDKVRLRILSAALFVALVLFILCILLTIGRANVTGYIPTLIIELDRSLIGKPPLVLGTVQLPKMSGDFPDRLEFPAQTVQGDVEFDQAFTPKINRRVEYRPVVE